MPDSTPHHVSSSFRSTEQATIAMQSVVQAPTGTATRDRGYPRPQLERQGWVSLNGEWDFALDTSKATVTPADVSWTTASPVPFSPETPASGAHHPGFLPVCGYRRRNSMRRPAATANVCCCISARWTTAPRSGSMGIGPDSTLAATSRGARHRRAARGGIRTAGGRAGGGRSNGPDQAAGKQDWQVEPHSIWYPRTTGIWQTVWLEIVPPTRIGRLRWTANLERWELALNVRISGAALDGLCLHVELRVGDRLLARDAYSVQGQEVHRRIAMSNPGIDDYRNELLWSPEPHTDRRRAAPATGRASKLDWVTSYTALRSVHVDGRRFLLNNRPSRCAWCSTGYWPDTGLTAPDDGRCGATSSWPKPWASTACASIRSSKTLATLLADRLGLLVWATRRAPTASRSAARARLARRMDRRWCARRQPPPIVAWAPFNQSWGAPELGSAIVPKRDFVAARHHLTRSLDPSRPVIGNDGWESVSNRHHRRPRLRRRCVVGWGAALSQR